MKGGDKIFERDITTRAENLKPVLNWNIFKDVFVFQENDSELCMVKCFPNSKCLFFKFVLPQEYRRKDRDNKDIDRDNKDIPNRLIGYWKENILLVMGNKIYYFNVDRYLSLKEKSEMHENSYDLIKTEVFTTEVLADYYPVSFISV